LGPLLVAIHHIRSNSAPGLPAKPVIVLPALVADIMVLDRAPSRVDALGYHWRGAFGIAGRR
jgi:GrpB-like predicted nucleotidyltransferase (UPF0157 family)